MTCTATDGERRLLSIEQAAVYLGIGRTTAFGLANSGELPTMRLGCRRFVRLTELRRITEGAS